MPPLPSSQEVAVHDDVFDLVKRLAAFCYQRTTDNVQRFFRRFQRKRKVETVNKMQHHSSSFDHQDLSEAYDEHADEDDPLVPQEADDGSEVVRLTKNAAAK
ncbi:hypothetical protein MPSEU_000829000 [Mayamaea pseudoterrestris]|nr:hypothetical protein MPSEU_000829000 [Mayamaea pseudoterrestris]